MSNLSVMRITVMRSAVISVIAVELALMHCSAKTHAPVSIICLISLHFIMSKQIYFFFFFGIIKLDEKLLWGYI